MRRLVGGAAVVAAVAALGCGDGGPKRSRLTGEVKYDGQPIPFGDIVFTPDGAKKNSGPQGFADVRDGRYDTGGEKGVGGGPTIVRVTGFTGPGGTLICEVELPLDLPRDGGAFNIDVPKQAAPKVDKKPADI